MPLYCLAILSVAFANQRVADTGGGHQIAFVGRVDEHLRPNRAAVVGRSSTWNFIQGAETVRLYQAILRRVRSNSSRVVVPFRCDAPTLRRHMRLEISSQPLAHISHTHRGE